MQTANDKWGEKDVHKLLDSEDYRESQGKKTDTTPRLKVKWLSIGENGPNINHLLISGWSWERGRKERREIAQLVLHPSSVWIGCQLDTGNIRWLIFSTGWRAQSDIGWISQPSSEMLRFTAPSEQPSDSGGSGLRTENQDYSSEVHGGVLW